MHKDNTTEMIFLGFGCLIGLWILMRLLPYLIGVLALGGVIYLYEEYGRNDRR